MARIFITGSADGLGQLAAKLPVKACHEVVLHARNKVRGQEALEKVPGAGSVLIADLSVIEETKNLAIEANQLGAFDAVIHNAGVYQASGRLIFTINTLAPYILTCLMKRPKRLIYLSSGLHMQGKTNFSNPDIDRVTYSDSKLHINILTMVVARKWPEIFSNAVNPGWVPTKMGGAHATDSLEKGFQTQAWLATSDEPEARVTGKYFFHKKQTPQRPEANNVNIQEEFISMCEQLTGIPFPVD